jgi:pyruvate dehydrogenase E2 component (dihydrolipoamide acetyltransferase)
MEKCEYRGNAIRYRKTGPDTGTALVLIHGAGGDSRLFNCQLSGLGRDFRLIIPDLPGHGQSPCDYLPTLSDYAGSIEEICAREGVAQIIPVGLSMGGAVALELFSRMRDIIRGFVFISTGPVLPVAPVVFELIERDFDSFCDFLVKFTFSAETPEGVKRLSLKDLKATGRTILENDFRICSLVDNTRLVSRVDVPALIIVNAGDRMIPPAVAEGLHAGITASKMLVYPGDGHVPQIDSADRVNGDIREFVQGLP